MQTFNFEWLPVIGLAKAIKDKIIKHQLSDNKK